MAEHLALAKACAVAASPPDSELIVQNLSLIPTDAFLWRSIQKREVLREAEGKDKDKGRWRGESENDPLR